MRNLHLLLSCLLVATLATSSSAVLVISDTNSETVIDFESTIDGVNVGKFTAAGLRDSSIIGPGQIDDSAWSFVGFGLIEIQRGELPSGANESSKAGIYSFTGANGSATMGVQSSSSKFNPGSITLSVMNDTGEAVDSWEVNFDLYSLNDQDHATSWNFSYSVDGITFTPETSLDYTSIEAADGSPSWELAERETQLAASVPDGSTLQLRWSSVDVSGAGGHDEFALDNIGVSAIAAIPEPTAFLFGSLLVGGFGLVGCRRRRR